MPILTSAEYLRSAILFVAQNQNKDGGFTSITRSEDKSAVNHSTIFYPALIGSILASIKIKETRDIIKKINYFLETEISPSGLWSYWAKMDAHNEQFNYPPDLDDISLSIAFKSVTNNLETQILVNYIYSLTKNEEKPGGPYKTWMTIETGEDWSDIDPIVNASIAYALKQQKVALPDLNEYLIRKITTGTWRSPYYVSESLMLFLLDRTLNGQCDAELKKILEDYFQTDKKLSLLDLALTLVLLIKVDSDSDLINQYARKIIGIGQAYVDDPCILEKQTTTTKEISGCACLTATVCILAISCFDEYEKKQNIIEPILVSCVEDQLHDVIVAKVAKKLNQLDHELFSVGLGEFSKLVSAPVAREITLISYDIGFALNIDIPLRLYVELGVANLWGWLSYQLYDGCYDEDIISQNLSLANICLREATIGYQEVAKKYNAPVELVTDTFDHIDLAHAYELQERANFSKNLISGKEWLSTTTLNLCERSFGHCLGPQLIAIIGQQTRETQSHIKKLFSHYLNARQMCDDLHDWHEDYSANRLTGVTKPLFLSCYAFPTMNNTRVAKEIFWEEGIVVAIRQAQMEIEQAIYFMRKIPWYKKPPDILAQSIDHLHEALQNVAREHKIMGALIKHYN